MNKTTKPAANPTLGVCSYESPALNVVEVHSEGVLCMSGQHEKWAFDEDLWS
jgi:hypothetical protein